MFQFNPKALTANEEKTSLATLNSFSPSLNFLSAGRARIVTQNICDGPFSTFVTFVTAVIFVDNGEIVVVVLMELVPFEFGSTEVTLVLELFDLVVLSTVVLETTMVLFTKLMLPKTLAVEMHGIVIEAVFAADCLHSVLLLSWQGTLLLTQFVCFSFVQGTVEVALATHITAPLLVHREVVFAGQKVPLSPTQATIALGSMVASFGTVSLL